MANLGWIPGELSELEQQGNLRLPGASASDGTLIDVCSNDYLGYAAARVSRETSVRGAAQVGAGASRLVSGTHPAHLQLETAVASWLGAETALTFSSGYVANLSAIPALVGDRDAVFSDALNHASIVDGCRLSRAKVHIYPHLDLQALHEALTAATPCRRRLVVSESYFSMDGDCPDLPRLAAICREAGAMLMLDEAHALGVFGPEGAGLAREAGVTPDVLVGTFGKALGSQGAFIAGSVTLQDWLWNRARGFVFSTGTSPLLAALTLENLQRARSDDPGRQKLRHLCQILEAHLSEVHLLSPTRVGPIFPIILNTSKRALRASVRLHEAGFLAQAIRPPSVPEGAARLRITLNSTMEASLVERLARELVSACAL